MCRRVWLCRVYGEQALPLGSVEPGKEKHRHEDRHSAHELLPEGLYLEGLSIRTERIGIRVAAEASRARCPLCGLVSSRIHSRYSRTVSDLPWHGISVALEVRARRFFCGEASCERRIFCERVPEIAVRARKTDRLEQALLAIALELGGRAGARLALELGIVAARDALLRRIKAAPCRRSARSGSSAWTTSRSRRAAPTARSS
jgi:transposase